MKVLLRFIVALAVGAILATAATLGWSMLLVLGLVLPSREGCKRGLLFSQRFLPPS